jgi:hypothetical protein
MVASAGLALIAVSATTLALASIPSNPGDAGADAVLHGTEAGLPTAVSGTGLFDTRGGPVCYGKDAVLAYFDGDRAQVGGELVTLEAGFDQDFADVWRSETSLSPVAISGVFAHVFPAASGNMVDVVELGDGGCAISRTLLTEDEWNQILVRAAGFAV